MNSLMDRHPTTHGMAWEQLLDELKHESVCYIAGMQKEGEFRPLVNGVNYGQAVYNAVETLMETGTFTIAQIMAITQLCHWVARSAKQL